MVYKREPHLFCPRCGRSYDPATRTQIANWAWLALPAGGFVPRYPDGDYAKVATNKERQCPASD
jgi:hypothetical protein